MTAKEKLAEFKVAFEAKDHEKAADLWREFVDLVEKEANDKELDFLSYAAG
jgi:hypothetical protein